jgi:2-polyprenyl-3-methyl-5-hydroxy-6-metoxy-1,4-benzoquinol methylase
MLDAKIVPSALSNELTYQRNRAMSIQQVTRTHGCVVERYRQHRLWRLFPKEFVFASFGVLQNKRVLDFGCGEGHVAVQAGLLGAWVAGIDISQELIELAHRRAELDQVQDRVEFKACDITASPPADETFDFVICTDALHHVDLSAVVPILYRCLKPDGTLIAMEPISLSPLLQAIRDRLPIEKVASPGDRQFDGKDIAYLCQVFPINTVTYFTLCSRLSRFIANGNKIDRGHPFTRAAMIALFGLDWLLTCICPFLRRFYGEVVFVGRKAAV